MPELNSLKRIYTYCLTISIGQESRHGLAGSSAQDLHKTAIEVSARALVSNEGSTERVCTSKFIHTIGGKIQSS